MGCGGLIVLGLPSVTTHRQTGYRTSFGTGRCNSSASGVLFMRDSVARTIRVGHLAGGPMLYARAFRVVCRSGSLCCGLGSKRAFP